VLPGGGRGGAVKGWPSQSIYAHPERQTPTPAQQRSLWQAGMRWMPGSWDHRSGLRLRRNRDCPL